MTMKKCLVVLLISLLFLTSACSSHQETATVPESTTTGPAKWPMIGSCIYRFDDIFMAIVRNAMAEEAEQLGAELEIADSENSQPTQYEQVEQFVQNGKEVLIINPVDATAAAQMIDKAKAVNLPLIFLNRLPEESILNSYDKVWYVGSIREEQGAFSAQILADYFLANPAADKNGDGKIQYVSLSGEPGHSDAAFTHNYFVKALEDADFELDKLAEDTGMWDRIKSKDKTDSWLLNIGPERMEAIRADNDDMALGAIDALQAIGYNTGDPEKYIPVVGIDATADALDAIETGFMLGTVLNDAETQGKTAVRMAIAAAKGEALNRETIGYDLTDGKYVWIPNIKITKANVAQYR